jgi:hypothetical protein
LYFAIGESTAIEKYNWTKRKKARIKRARKSLDNYLFLLLLTKSLDSFLNLCVRPVWNLHALAWFIWLA